MSGNPVMPLSVTSDGHRQHTAQHGAPEQQNCSWDQIAMKNTTRSKQIAAFGGKLGCFKVINQPEYWPCQPQLTFPSSQALLLLQCTEPDLASSRPPTEPFRQLSDQNP